MLPSSAVSVHAFHAIVTNWIAYATHIPLWYFCGVDISFFCMPPSWNTNSWGYSCSPNGLSCDITLARADILLARDSKKNCSKLLSSRIKQTAYCPQLDDGTCHPSAYAFGYKMTYPRTPQHLLVLSPSHSIQRWGLLEQVQKLCHIHSRWSRRLVFWRLISTSSTATSHWNSNNQHKQTLRSWVPTLNFLTN